MFNGGTDSSDAKGIDSMDQCLPLSFPSHYRYNDHCTCACFTFTILQDMRMFNSIFVILIMLGLMLDMGRVDGVYLRKGGGILHIQSRSIYPTKCFTTQHARGNLV